MRTQIKVQFVLDVEVHEGLLAAIQEGYKRTLGGGGYVPEHARRAFLKLPPDHTDEQLLHHALGEDVANLLETQLAFAYPKGSTIKKIEYSEVQPPLPPPVDAVPQIIQVGDRNKAD